jgi:hypothetical protein
MTTPFYLWLEPVGPGTDLDEGLRARVADPVWFLTRQWQLGEHQGEDASSPVAVTVSVDHVPLTYDPRRPTLDPTVVPAEALVEAEPGDWWTMGRRIRLGRAAEPFLTGLPPTRLRALKFGRLPAAYSSFEGEIDGRAVFTSALLPANAIWSEVPSPPADHWSDSHLCYDAAFRCGGVALSVTDHDGGDVDWFTVDGPPPDAPIGTQRTPTPAGSPAPPRTVIPGRLDYPGAPNPRWWQFEDRQVDVGGFSPDRSHLGSILLLDVVLAHSDDWFWFPVPPPPPALDANQPPSSGVVVTLNGASVKDSFDQIWELAVPPVEGPGGWSLFQTTGLSPACLVIWPIAVAPASGAALDDVVLGVDEDANLAWAVELAADGQALLEDAKTDEAILQTARTGSRGFTYLPSTALPNHWQPYMRTDGGGLFGSWQQGIVSDLTGEHPRPRPGPVSRLIGGPSGPGGGRGQVLDGHAIPSTGLRIQRRAMLARDTAGKPVLWVERTARPLLGPPTSHLRFDVLAEAPATGQANE